MDISLPVGTPPAHQGPLSRFVPPMAHGVVGKILEKQDLPGQCILDPFGVSPRVPIEVARAGRSVVVIANNPISRFILEHTLKPFSLSDLRAALAQIASLPKDDTRMEHFLLDLYRSRCARCGGEVVVDFYIWDKELGGPSHKVYACEHCAHAGENPATDDDWEQALDYSRRGLHHAMAVEQVAPRDDPDRKHAEAALAVYPGRAIYAITTLINKIQQLRLDPDLQSAIHALLLSTFDAGNALWGYPDGRERPRQLIASLRYREFNLWRALEQAVGTWALDDPHLDHIELERGVRLEPGRIHIFHGSYAELNKILGPESIDHIISVPPRPNQAFWTLSALWAAWLWGQEAAAPIKVALRRRRYDWAWHASAIHTVINQIAPMLKLPSKSAIYLPESEPGFLASALSSFDASGFDLQGRAMRAHEGQAFLLWQITESRRNPVIASVPTTQLGRACLELLEARCEPAGFTLVHAAAWSYLAAEHYTRALWDTDTRQMMQTIGDRLSAALNDADKFSRLGRGIEIETGLYWITDPPECGLTLADRVEQLVMSALRTNPDISLTTLDEYVCDSLRGLLTPGQRLVLTALQSYAEPVGDGLWRLRDEDQEAARAKDLIEIRDALVELGHRLGYDVETDDRITWSEGEDEKFRFQILETAITGTFDLESRSALILVMPGGRASLLSEKSRRDARIREWLQGGQRILKFRHVRRLVSETTLRRENFSERLAIDPPEHQDPQLPLL